MPVAGTKSVATVLQPAPNQPQTPLDNSNVNVIPQHPSYIQDLRWAQTAPTTTVGAGMPWPIDLLLGLRTVENRPVGQELSTPASYQSYRRIRNYVLMVDSALSVSQDEETKQMTVRGGGTIAHGIIPNKGDMFLADIGQNKMGVFQIVSSEKVTPLAQSTYRVEYILTTDSQVFIDDLLAKVVQVLYFDETATLLGRKNIVTDERYGQLKQIKQEYANMTEHWLARFYSHEVRTLILPSNVARFYDPFVVRAVKKAFSRADHMTYSNINEYEMEYGLLKQDSLWDVMLAQASSRLPFIFREFGVASRSNLPRSVMTASFRFSRIDHLIMPKNSPYRVDMSSSQMDKVLQAVPLSPLGALAQDEGVINEIAQSIQLNQMGADYITLPPIAEQSTYVLSQAFYDNANSLNPLELIVKQMMSASPLDYGVILNALKSYMYWGKFEQFYYGLILLIAMKSCLQGDR